MEPPIRGMLGWLSQERKLLSFQPAKFGSREKKLAEIRKTDQKTTQFCTTTEKNLPSLFEVHCGTIDIVMLYLLKINSFFLIYQNI